MAGRRYALIGFPLAHSLSAVIHKRLFSLSGITDASYELLEISRDRIDAAWRELFDLDGFNVTLPYKIAAFHALSHLDQSARRYGAVNTVHRPKEGDPIGYNTDVDGFLQSVRAIGSSLGGRVLLLGCGGAGRMAAIETARSGGSLTIAVRDSSMERAHNLQQSIAAFSPSVPVAITPTRQISHRQFDLLINATPCGMYPNANDMPIDPGVLETVDAVFDMIYNPRKTRLVRLAEARRIPATGGMTMLVWQAAAAHKIWYGADFRVSEIKALIEEMNRELS